jgi:hypothetical protein
MTNILASQKSRDRFLEIVESGDPLKDFYDEDDLASAVVELMRPKGALKTLSMEFKRDPDYAWAWHCNIACAFMDAGGLQYPANMAAAQFMKSAFGVDTMKQVIELNAKTPHLGEAF